VGREPIGVVHRELDSHGPLPVRSRLQVDEWIETFLVDTARDNGVRRPWLDHLRTVRQSLIDSPNFYPGVDRALGLTDRDGSAMYGGRPLPAGSRVGRAGFIRYCPMCMVSSAYVRTRWRILDYQVCVEHGCLMKDDLIEPAFTATYKNSPRHVYGLADGDKLLTGATSPTASAVLLHTKLWKEFDDLDRAGRGLGEDAAKALAWAVLGQRLIDVAMGDARGGQPAADPLEAVNRRAAWTSSHRLEIEASQDGVTSFLICLPSTRSRRNARRFLMRAIRREEAHPSVISLLPLTSVVEWLDCSGPEALAEQKPWTVMLAGVLDESISSRQTCEELGISSACIYTLVQRGWLRPTHIERYGQRQYRFFARAAVRELKRRLQSLVSVDSLVQSRGLSWAGYFSLRRAGWLNPIVVGDQRHVRAGEVQALLTRLEDRARPIEMADRSLLDLFGDSVFGGARQKVTAELMRSVMDGRVDLYKDLTRTGFAAFRVPDTITVDRHRLALASSHRDHVGVDPRQLELLETT